MKEIDYRAWDRVAKKMHDWKEVQTWADWWLRGDLILMQYSGERDFNGRKIYAGDKLRGHDENDNYDNSTKLWLYKGFETEVKVKDGAFVVDACGGDYDETAIGWAKDAGFSYEIVGNIYKE